MRLIVAIAAACAWAGVYGVAYADTLTLKSGMRVQGVWKGGAGDNVLFLTRGPKPESYPLSEIASIDFSADTRASIPTQKIQGLAFEFVDAVAENDTLRVTLNVTNGGTDLLEINFAANTQPPPPKLTDDAGNAYVTRDVTIGNNLVSADLLNGARTRMVITFSKLPAVKGVVTMANIRH